MKKNWMLRLISATLLALLILGLLCACGKDSNTPPSSPSGEQTTAGTKAGTPIGEPTGESNQTENSNQPENPNQPGQPETNPWGISDGDVQTPKSKIYHN